MSTEKPSETEGKSARCSECGAVLEADALTTWLLSIVSEIRCEACVRKAGASAPPHPWSQERHARLRTGWQWWREDEDT